MKAEKESLIVKKLKRSRSKAIQETSDTMSRRDIKREIEASRRVQMQPSTFTP